MFAGYELQNWSAGISKVNLEAQRAHQLTSKSELIVLTRQPWVREPIPMRCSSFSGS